LLAVFLRSPEKKSLHDSMYIFHFLKKNRKEKRCRKQRMLAGDRLKQGMVLISLLLGKRHGYLSEL
jgi:hypothetical protein